MAFWNDLPPLPPIYLNWEHLDEQEKWWASRGCRLARMDYRLGRYRSVALIDGPPGSSEASSTEDPDPTPTT